MAAGSLNESIDCLIGMGSNLGDRHQNLEAAITSLNRSAGITVVTTSTLRESAPVGGPYSQSAYLNGALGIRSTLSPAELLHQLLETERSLGRERDMRWGPRTVDLDLLLYGDRIIREAGLLVPHPWMAIRRFVMEPAAEVSPNSIHPEIQWTVTRIWRHLQNCRPLIAIAGLTDGQRPQIAEIAEKQKIELISRSSILKNISPIVQANNVSVLPESETIEFHDAMVAAVQTRMSTSGSRPVLCDFWWEQPLMHHHSIMPPKVFPPDLLLVVSNKSAGTSRNQKDREAQHRLTQLATRPKTGPFLRLNPENPTRFVHDITAAIEGMRVSE